MKKIFFFLFLCLPILLSAEELFSQNKIKLNDLSLFYDDEFSAKAYDIIYCKKGILLHFEEGLFLLGHDFSINRLSLHYLAFSRELKNISWLIPAGQETFLAYQEQTEKLLWIKPEYGIVQDKDFKLNNPDGACCLSGRSLLVLFQNKLHKYSWTEQGLQEVLQNSPLTFGGKIMRRITDKTEIAFLDPLRRQLLFLSESSFFNSPPPQAKAIQLPATTYQSPYFDICFLKDGRILLASQKQIILLDSQGHQLKQFKRLDDQILPEFFLLAEGESSHYFFLLDPLHNFLYKIDLRLKKSAVLEKTKINQDMEYYIKLHIKEAQKAITMLRPGLAEKLLASPIDFYRQRKKENPLEINFSRTLEQLLEWRKQYRQLIHQVNQAEISLVHQSENEITIRLNKKIDLKDASWSHFYEDPVYSFSDNQQQVSTDYLLIPKVNWQFSWDRMPAWQMKDIICILIKENGPYYQISFP